MKHGDTYYIRNYSFPDGESAQVFVYSLPASPPATRKEIRTLCNLYSYALHQPKHTVLYELRKRGEYRDYRVLYASPEWTAEQWAYFLKETERNGYPPQMPGPAYDRGRLPGLHA